MNAMDAMDSSASWHSDSCIDLAERERSVGRVPCRFSVLTMCCFCCVSEVEHVESM